MQDWMFETADPILVLPPDVSGPSPEDGAQGWFGPTGDDPDGLMLGFGLGDGGDGGVTKVGDIIVTGDPDPDSDPYDEWWETGTPGSGTSPGNPGSSVGGGHPPIPPPDPYDACDDRKADALAAEVNDEIQQQPDKATREYGALIWKDAQGNLHRTELVAGTNGNVAWPADPRELGMDSYSQVVGMVHSHPSLVEIGGAWVPASHGGIHGGDWIAADGWVGMHGLDQVNFTMYVSYQGVIQEYDYADNTDAPRAAVDDRGSVESGDYDPGAICP